ncbi:hypothetical protein BJY52DRAFT_1190818 [Lactarius psammicola]|nr:hypothetical protein BJY52DRAFT_1190818 [Lactarius psammicola]
MGELAQTVGDMAAPDFGRSLSHSLDALAELKRIAQETEYAQARADQASLLSTADEYARLVNSVRLSLGRMAIPAGAFTTASLALISPDDQSPLEPAAPYNGIVLVSTGTVKEISPATIVPLLPTPPTPETPAKSSPINPTHLASLADAHNFPKAYHP